MRPAGLGLCRREASAGTSARRQEAGGSPSLSPLHRFLRASRHFLAPLLDALLPYPVSSQHSPSSRCGCLVVQIWLQTLFGIQLCPEVYLSS